MVKYIILLALLFSYLSAFAQYNPHAGIIPSHTAGATLISSSNSRTLAKAFDGNKDTHWQSGAPLPYGFVSNPYQNLVFGQTNDGLTDGHLGRAIILRDGAAATLTLANQSAKYIVIKANIVGQLSLKLTFASGNSEVIETLDNTSNNQIIRIDVSPNPITSIEVKADTLAQVFELAVLSTSIEEFVGYVKNDLHELGQLNLRTWSGSKPAIASRLEVTVDGESWSPIKTLDPLVLTAYTIVLDTPRQVRGARIVHTLNPKDWEKVSIWEIQAYDRYGKYGPLPANLNSSVTFSTMLGLNSVWGWGQNKYSDLLDSLSGPQRFSRAFSKARYYHNLDWDISAPGEFPAYVGMSQGSGTQSKSWLNWDREHQAWQEAGLEVNPTIRVSVFGESKYSDPFEQTRIWAADFSAHFGTGSFGTVEVGNEPWSFTADTYTSILEGAISGFRQNPLDFKILPCALQAVDSTAESSSNQRNYIGARLNETILQKIDGLNVHTYSYVTSTDGIRRAVYPEHPASSWGELNNAIRFRDANRSDLPIYLTELGYDSDGGGQNCLHNECLTEQEAAAYTLRSLLIANRLGIRRADYYFYANSKKSGLYTRSGLVSSTTTGSVSKLSFTTLGEFASLLAPYRVVGVEQENSSGYIYRLSDEDGNIIYAAWLPTDLSSTPTANSYIATKTLIKTFDPMGSQGPLVSPWPSIWR